MNLSKRGLFKMAVCWTIATAVAVIVVFVLDLHSPWNFLAGMTAGGSGMIVGSLWALNE